MLLENVETRIVASLSQRSFMSCTLCADRSVRATQAVDGRVARPHIYFFVHWSTQSFTVLYQSCEFCGFSTQWPSSGK